uniref:Uncharacterized protein n=1 Tax=Oryza brachyantha TaxID=4533 RepID=J3L758_ORYBR
RYTPKYIEHSYHHKSDPQKTINLDDFCVSIPVFGLPVLLFYIKVLWQFGRLLCFLPSVTSLQ